MPRVWPRGAILSVGADVVDIVERHTCLRQRLDQLGGDQVRLGHAQHLSARARGIDQHVARAVIDHVAGVALHHLLERDAERVRGFPDLLDGAAEADQALVESLGEAAQQGPFVTLGIDRDEQRLDVLASASDLIERVDQPLLGAGEAATAPVAAALANAVFDATGVRLRMVPFTPERVKAALANRSQLKA